MLKKVSLILALLAIASIASANSLTLGTPETPGDMVINGEQGRGLVNDGSFEFGECDAGSAWTCTSSTTCFWIIDPTAVWGYPAYDGVFCAWLGGFCGEPNSNSFCQTIFFDGTDISFFWMGYVENGGTGNTMFVKVDGNVVFEHEMQLEDHTYGTWGYSPDAFGLIDVSDYCGSDHELCLEFVATDGANVLVDYVELNGSCGTATEEASFSTVKALY